VRAGIIATMLMACSSAPPARPTVSQPAVHVRTCSEAAVGLDRATQTLREPDAAVLAPLKTKCVDGAWSQGAIDCFATMKVDDLAKCAAMLPDRPREAMFQILADREPTTAALAIAKARLDAMKVGVDECDRFIEAVSAVLTCESMPLEARVQLGNETADVWSLPTARLSPDAHARMATACATSLHTLEKRVADVGCMP
jgi:hypothetical protein